MSEKAKKPMPMKITIIKSQDDVTKSETPTHISESEETGASDWLPLPADFKGYETIVDESRILPQCIKAYKQNICGFGIGIQYKEDTEETSEMAAEYDKANKILKTLSLDSDVTAVMKQVIGARETFGTAYVEVVRNTVGEVVQIEFISDTDSITKTKPLDPAIDMTYFCDGEPIIRKKKFRKYRQDISGKTVYFKELGDPRIMDRRNGHYLDKYESLEVEHQANEIQEFTIGSKPYGKIRWIGQILGSAGARKADYLNYNYFRNGRHIPLMLILKGGTLSEDSRSSLETYMNDVKGENGQHAFLLLEEESKDGAVPYETTEKPDIEIKELSSILQKDELFQGYIDNNRKSVQSSFQLPDLYVGYTTDFNRATAQTAMEVTEEQVFQPERKELAWIFNNKLLNSYGFKHVEVYFKAPDLSNPDDIAKILAVCKSAGGLTPNKAKDILYKALGEVSEDYEGEWGNLPLGFNLTPQEASQTALHGIASSLEQQIQKAEKNHDGEVVAIMREVKKLLIAKSEGQENTPTDEQ